MRRHAPDRLTGSTFTLAFASFALRAAAKVRNAIGNRIAVARLTELDDRALKDIGLLRSDVAAALALPYHRDPSAHLADVAGGGRALSSDRQSSSGVTAELARLRRPDAPVTAPAAAAC